MQNACMVALQIRDVPDEVRDILTTRAREQGKSLQGFLLELVKGEAERANNLTILRRFEDRKDGTGESMQEVVQTRDAARAERDAHLGAVEAAPPEDLT